MPDSWEIKNDDCVEVLQKCESDRFGYSIFSPPFSDLFVYSDNPRDMGNSKNHDQFFEHFRFLQVELARVMQPGRNVSIHCMDLTRSKFRDGNIGLVDFPGRIIASMEAAGFIYHSRVTIWKDPVTSMQRTKALGLLHKQLKKDSCMSRQGLPDYLITFRKPGENPRPVDGDLETFAGDGDHRSIEAWQRYASPVWMDIRQSRTLQKESAREDKDEKHICPLQLDVIERGVQLWSKENDEVLSPFCGIGSEGFVSVKMGRRFFGVELKKSYYRQAVSNLKAAEVAMDEPVLI